MGQAFDFLPRLVRARRYREMADGILDLSLTATNLETMIAYLDLAAGWLALARGLEGDSDEALLAARDGTREADRTEFER